MEKIEGLLQLFTARFPPPEQGAHVFKLRQDGKDGLELVLNVRGKFYTFGFDPKDFMRSDGETMDKVTVLLKQVMSPDAAKYIESSPTEEWKLK
jgi:nicotinic acid phosphoribosyltransferase